MLDPWQVTCTTSRTAIKHSTSLQKPPACVCLLSFHPQLRTVSNFFLSLSRLLCPSYYKSSATFLSTALSSHRHFGNATTTHSLQPLLCLRLKMNPSGQPLVRDMSYRKPVPVYVPTPPPSPYNAPVSPSRLLFSLSSASHGRTPPVRHYVALALVRIYCLRTLCHSYQKTGA